MLAFENSNDVKAAMIMARRSRCLSYLPIPEGVVFAPDCSPYKVFLGAESHTICAEWNVYARALTVVMFENIRKRV